MKDKVAISEMLFSNDEGTRALAVQLVIDNFRDPFLRIMLGEAGKWKRSMAIENGFRELLILDQEDNLMWGNGKQLNKK